MNILFIQHSASIGGAPKSLALLSNACRVKGHRVTIISMRKGPSNSVLSSVCSRFLIKRSFYPFHATEVSGISLQTKVRNILGLFFNLFSFIAIKKESPDLIYLNSSCNSASVIVFKMLYPQVPVITHIREPILSSFWGRLLNKMVNFVSDEIVAISQNDANSLNVDCRTNIIFNSTEIPYQYNRLVGCNIFLTVSYVARVSEENGLLEFIDACLATNVKGIKLLLCGFSKVPTTYEKEILNKIKLLNYIEIIEQTDDVSKIYLRTDVLISPFIKPHFSRSVIESASYGVPSVITDVGSQSELVINGVSGYVCKNVDEMLLNLNFLSANRGLLKNMSSQARELAKAQFDSNKSITQNVNLIERTFHV